jgi:hypothetical protein
MATEAPPPTITKSKNAIKTFLSGKAERASFVVDYQDSPLKNNFD